MAVLHGLNLFYRVSCRPRRTKLPAERGRSEKSKRHAARQRSTRDIGGVSAIANALFFREHDVGGLGVEAANRSFGESAGGPSSASICTVRFPRNHRAMNAAKIRRTLVLYPFVCALAPFTARPCLRKRTVTPAHGLNPRTDSAEEPLS